MAAGSGDAGDLGWGTAVAERGIPFRVRIEALVAAGGAINAGTLSGCRPPDRSGSRSQRFFIFSQADSGASAGRSPAAGVSIADILESVGSRGRRLAGRQQQGRLGRCRRHGRWRRRRRRPVGGWFWSTGRVGAWAPSRDFRNRASPTRRMLSRGSKEQAEGSGGYFLIPKKRLRSILGNYEPYHLWRGDQRGLRSPLCGSEPGQSPSAQGTVRTTFADIPGVLARGDIHRRAAKKQLLRVIGGPGKLFLPVGAKTCFGGWALMQQGRQECRPSDGPATLLSPMVATKACFAPPPPTL